MNVHPTTAVFEEEAMGVQVRNRSKALRQRAVRRIPGGVNSNVRLSAPKIFFARAEGAWLWDVDGNNYVDYLLGQGPAFLGHAPEPVVNAVEAVTRTGMVFAAQNPWEVEAAEKICATLRWADMVRFGSSGSEMVHVAIRLARAATRRRRFIRFEGHYHGWFDNVFVAMQPGGGPATAGQSDEDLADAIVLPWNDLDQVQAAFEQHGDEIAAVITEPIMFNSGAILPRDGYLAGIRRLCDDTGAVLIMDEIITGFRVGLRGAAAMFDVTPDLATYGKAMAGGWPVAALAGRAHLMERIGTGEVNHSGTFNANVMGCAAVCAAIDTLTETDPYPAVREHGQRLMAGLKRVAREASIQLRVEGLPMAFHVAFAPPDMEVNDLSDLQHMDAERYQDLVSRFVANGLWVAGRGIWYVSTAHGDLELDAALERAAKAVAEMPR